MDTLSERTLGILLGVAQKRSTITYTRLGDLLGLRMDWNRDRARLGTILFEVNQISDQDWSVLLAVLAVGKADNMPSGRPDPGNTSGFYAYAELAGRDISDPRKLVMTEQAKIYKRFAA